MVYVMPATALRMRTLGEHFRNTRKLLELTIDDVAARARVSPTTVRNIEQGKSVRTDSFFCVASVLRVLDPLVDAANPFNTTLGQIRGIDNLPQRVRYS